MQGLVAPPVKSLVVNIIGFVGQEAKLSVLNKYLYNKREK